MTLVPCGRAAGRWRRRRTGGLYARRVAVRPGGRVPCRRSAGGVSGARAGSMPGRAPCRDDDWGGTGDAPNRHPGVGATVRIRRAPLPRTMRSRRRPDGAGSTRARRGRRSSRRRAVAGLRAGRDEAGGSTLPEGGRRSSARVRGVARQGHADAPAPTIAWRGGNRRVHPTWRATKGQRRGIAPSLASHFLPRKRGGGAWGQRRRSDQPNACRFVFGAACPAMGKAWVGTRASFSFCNRLDCTPDP